MSETSISIRKKVRVVADPFNYEKVLEDLKNLGPNARQVSRDRVTKLYDGIQEALARGASWRDIATRLRKAGFVISEKTLETYVSEETERRQTK